MANMLSVLEFYTGDSNMKKITIILFSFLLAGTASAACDDFRMFSIKTFDHIEKLALKEVKKFDAGKNIDLTKRNLDKQKLFYKNAQELLQKGTITQIQLTPYKLNLDEAQLAFDVANSNLELVAVEVEYATAVLNAGCRKVQASAEDLQALAKTYVTKWQVKTRHGAAKADVATRRSNQVKNRYLYHERLAARGTMNTTDLEVTRIELEKSVIKANHIQNSRLVSRKLLNRFIDIESAASGSN